MIETVYSAVLSDIDFTRLANYIHNNMGIKMPVSKKIMLQSRLRKRLLALGFESFDIYVKKFFSGELGDDETKQIYNCITTNKTDFFRENFHFEFVKKNSIDILALGVPLMILSCGCSSGEEAYSIAMTLLDAGIDGKNFRIKGIDISSKSLQEAVAAVYPLMKVSEVDTATLHKYFLKHKTNFKTVRIAPEVRNLTNFSFFNLMSHDYSPLGQFEIIFFRNVMIYFDKETQNRVLQNLVSILKPDGLLFLGHSESVFGANLPLVSLGQNIYKKRK